jgi:lysozyme
MRASYKCICMIAQEEAIVLVPYPDGPHFSIGVGHNDAALTAETPAITVEQALALLARDLVRRENDVTRALKVPVSQTQFDALIDGYFNKEHAVLPVIDLINKGDVPGAMTYLLGLDRNIHGVRLLGLARRRQRESNLFLTGDYGDLSAVKVYSADPFTTKPTIMAMPPVLASTVAAPTF